MSGASERSKDYCNLIYLTSRNFHRLKLDGTLNKLDQDTLVKVLEKVFTRPIDEIELN